jgi:hypothetical protein
LKCYSASNLNFNKNDLDKISMLFQLVIGLKVCLNQPWFQVKILVIFCFILKFYLMMNSSCFSGLNEIEINQKNYRFHIKSVLKNCWNAIWFLFWIPTSWYGLGFNTISTWNWVEILSKSTLISNQNTGVDSD